MINAKLGNETRMFIVTRARYKEIFCVQSNLLPSAYWYFAGPTEYYAGRMNLVCGLARHSSRSSVVRTSDRCAEGPLVQILSGTQIVPRPTIVIRGTLRHPHH